MDKKIILLILIGGAYYMWDQNNKLQLQLSQYTRYNGPAAWNNPRFRNVSPSPPRGSEAWKQWINSIVDLYGQVRDLWGPGGPFYNENKEDIYDVVNEGILV